MMLFEITWKEPEEEYFEEKMFWSYEELADYLKSELEEYGHLGVSVVSVHEIVRSPIAWEDLLK